MAFEDLRENLKNQFVQLGERITNSRLYSILIESYENLNSNNQRLVKIFCFVFYVCLFFFLGMY